MNNLDARLSNVEQTVNGFDNRLQTVEKLMTNVLKLATKETCTEIKQFKVDDGQYYIGEKDIFEAQCVKEDENTTTTIVETENQGYQQFEGCDGELGCSQVSINYKATDEELKQLVETSDECQQDWSFKCKNTPFIIGTIEKTWWTDIHGK